MINGKKKTLFSFITNKCSGSLKKRKKSQTLNKLKVVVRVITDLAGHFQIAYYSYLARITDYNLNLKITFEKCIYQNAYVNNKSLMPDVDELTKKHKLKQINKN